MTLPCLATVGNDCLKKSITHNPDGTVSFAAAGCECLKKGVENHVEVPGHPDLDPTCSLQCVTTISGLLNTFFENLNGDTGARADCEATLEELNGEVFGTGPNAYVAHSDDLDALTMYDTADPKVNTSAWAVWTYINSVRFRECPSLGFLTPQLTVDMAQGGEVTEGHHQFVLEVRRSLCVHALYGLSCSHHVCRDKTVRSAFAHRHSLAVDPINLEMF